MATAFVEKPAHVFGFGDADAPEGNFAMIKLAMSDSLAYRKLMARGVMIRSMTSFRFPNWIRVTLAAEEAMEAFVEALSQISRQTGCDRAEP